MGSMGVYGEILYPLCVCFVLRFLYEFSYTYFHERLWTDIIVSLVKIFVISEMLTYDNFKAGNRNFEMLQFEALA